MCIRDRTKLRLVPNNTHAGSNLWTYNTQTSIRPLASTSWSHPQTFRVSCPHRISNIYNLECCSNIIPESPQKNYPSVTLTRFFFIFGLEFLGVFNIASVVYHLRQGQLVSDFRFQILDFRLQISDFRFRISDFTFQFSDQHSWPKFRRR